MASKSSVAIFLTFNILFFTMVTASNNCPPPPKPKPTPCPPPPKPKTTPCPPPHTPKPTPSRPSKNSCPIDALKLGVCANLLGGLAGIVVGKPPTAPCCSVIEGLLDLEVAVCLCTAIKANVLGIHLNIPVALSLIIDGCGKKLPKGFQCA